jgi:ATP adenylyltransferase/5',5'''-P-1,P-4-tetraphosphate phosphorylase II
VSREGVDAFFEKQLAQWPDAAKRYEALSATRQRVFGNGVSLQYNPSRAVSTAAKVDAASIAGRPCFLCAGNRPAEQIAENALGSLELLVNPYPILPQHFTLPLKRHIPQVLKPMYADMLHLAGRWQGLAVFYNGAKCGASAPDHAHLQAVRCCDVPLLKSVAAGDLSFGEPVCVVGDASLYNVKGYVVPFFVIKSGKVSHSVELLNRLLAAMPVVDGEPEPRMNVISYYSATEGCVTVVIPRVQHRPACYYANDASKRLVSPGTLDMAGLVVTPRECDFESMTADEATALLREVAVSNDMLSSIIEKMKG